MYVYTLVAFNLIFMLVLFKYQTRDQPVSEIIVDPAYTDLFNATDLKVRSCSSQSECLTRYNKAIRMPNPQEQMVLVDAATHVDSLISTEFKKLAEIPWRIRLFDGDRVENGYPHTHGSYVIMPSSMVVADSRQLVSTLLHEKVHLFQRLYPAETNHLITRYMGFSIASLANKHANLRTNPDLNQLIYKYPDERLLLPTYTDNAISLSDIQDKNDHPFEIMAYSIQEMYVPLPGLYRYKQYHAVIKEWLHTL